MAHPSIFLHIQTRTKQSSCCHQCLVFPAASWWIRCSSDQTIPSCLWKGRPISPWKKFCHLRILITVPHASQVSVILSAVTELLPRSSTPLLGCIYNLTLLICLFSIPPVPKLSFSHSIKTWINQRPLLAIIYKPRLYNHCLKFWLACLYPPCCVWWPGQCSGLCSNAGLQQSETHVWDLKKAAKLLCK